MTAASDVMQTQSATVQTTLQTKQLQQLPLTTHTALDYIISLPGVNTAATGNTRASTINGLPNRAMNITMDGISVQDNRSSGEGFFMYIRPMMDSVEEITVSTSTPGAESSGIRRRADPHDDAQRLEPIQRVGVQLVAQPGGHERRRYAHAKQEELLAVAHEYAQLVQQARPAEDGGGRVLHRRHPPADARVPRRRPDPPEQGVLLRQRRVVQVAEFREPDSLFPQAGRRQRPLPLQGQQRGNADAQPARPCGVQRADGDSGPDAREALRRHPHGGGD